MIYKKLLNILESLLSSLSLFSFFALIFVVLLQITSRLFLPWVFAWTEELSRILFITAVCIISPVALRHNEFVFVDLIINKIKNKIYLEIANNFLLILFLFIIAYSSIGFLNLGYANTSPVLKIPMWIIYSMPFISFLFMLIFSIEKIVNLGLYKLKKGLI